MSIRLEILIAFLGIAIGLLVTNHYCIAIAFFVLCGLSLLEVIMFSLLCYSSKSLKIGKAKDAELIKVSLPSTFDVLCVPVSLRIRWWEAKDIRCEIKSFDIIIQTSPHDHCGNSSYDDTFTLDWRNTRRWIAIAYLSGGEMVIGNPVTHKFPGRRDSYPIILELWHSDHLIACSNYILDKNLCLSDKVA